jgi:hypothetical protein
LHKLCSESASRYRFAAAASEAFDAEARVPPEPNKSAEVFKSKIFKSEVFKP